MNRSALIFCAVLGALAGCSPKPEAVTNGGAANRPLQPVQDSRTSEISAEKIKSDVIRRVVMVSDVTGKGPETEWTFDADEYRQVEILESRATDNAVTLVIFMTTRNNPKPDEDNVQVSGKLHLRYARKAGQWVLTTIENLSFRYSVGLST